MAHKTAGFSARIVNGKVSFSKSGKAVQPPPPEPAPLPAKPILPPPAEEAVAPTPPKPKAAPPVRVVAPVPDPATIPAEETVAKEVTPQEYKGESEVGQAGRSRRKGKKDTAESEKE